MASTRRTDKLYVNIVVEAMTAAAEGHRIRSNQIYRAQNIARCLREELTHVLASDLAKPGSQPQRQKQPKPPWIRNMTQLFTLCPC